MLLVTGTQDQALLGLVVREAEQKVRNQGRHVGRTAIQKLIYFLKIVQVPMQYRFDIHYYGPYSAEVTKDIELLVADRVIRDESKEVTRFSDYAADEALNELISMHEAFLHKHESIVELVVETFGVLSPNELEQVATIDYLYRIERAKQADDQLRTHVLRRFKEVKGDRYQDKQVAGWYDSMVKLGLIA